MMVSMLHYGRPTTPVVIFLLVQWAKAREASTARQYRGLMVPEYSHYGQQEVLEPHNRLDYV